MKIGIIGPTNTNTLGEVNEDYKEIISKIAGVLAQSGDEIFITPDKGSSSEYFAQEYLRQEGKKVFEILPLDDVLGYDWVNTELGEHINCKVWRNQPGKLNDETDILICIGYGAGVLAEISYSKWPEPKPVYIIAELVTEELPKELDSSLDLRYISFENLKKELS